MWIVGHLGFQNNRMPCRNQLTPKPQLCKFHCNCLTNPPQPLNLGFTAYYPHLWLSYLMMTPDNHFHEQVAQFCSKMHPTPPNNNNFSTPQTLTVSSHITNQILFRDIIDTHHTAHAVRQSTVFIRNHTTKDQIVYNPMLLLLGSQAMPSLTLNIPRRLRELVKYIKVHSQQPTLPPHFLPP